MIALLDDPSRGVVRGEQRAIVMALDILRILRVRRRVAAAIAARPGLACEAAKESLEVSGPDGAPLRHVWKFGERVVPF